MKHSPTAQIQGGALVAVMMVVVVSLGLVSGGLYFSSYQNRLAARQREINESVAAADGALEYGFAVWKDVVRANANNPPTNKMLKQDTRVANWNSSAAAPGKDLTATGNAFSSFSIGATDASGLPISTKGLTDDDTPPKYDVAVDDYPGWKGNSYFYKASVTTTGPKTLATQKAATATLSRQFALTSVPIFQAAIFYMGDLEIHPGALMTIKGLVHTNANLYAAAFGAAGTKLQFLGNVSYAGTFQEGTPTTGDWTGGYGTAGTITTPYWSDNLQTASSTERAKQLTKVDPILPFGQAVQDIFDKQEAATVKDNNPNNDGYHEWIEPPASGTTLAEIEDVRLYNGASLRITIDSSKATSDPARISIKDGSGANLSGSDDTAIRNTIDAGTTIYDWREGGGVSGNASGNVKVTSVNVNALNTTLKNLGSKFNGVLYIQDVAAAKSALRLKNGSDLAVDLTVVSQNPIYIQGDYNTGFGTGTVHDPNTVPSNNGGNPSGTDSPVVSGYTKKSAAVIADAVMVLSNNWNDANSTKTVSYRTATPTTVNAAIMAGDVPTDSSSGGASGGAHNFPRFLEAWGNPYNNQYVDFTYYGSMVQAFTSKTFTGTWQTGNVYVWPSRKWNFEELFTTKPPPGTVTGTKCSRGRWDRT